MGRAGKDKVGQFNSVGGFVFDRSAWWYLVDFPIIIHHIVLDGILVYFGCIWCPVGRAVIKKVEYMV